MVITLRNLSRRQLQAFMWSCTPFERIDSSVIKEFVAGDTASLSLCIHFNAACWWPECELPVDCCSVPSPPPLCVCRSGPGSYPCSLLMCHSHRQEPLELFCESCDLLCCSSCHLSSHKNHRSVLRYTAQGHCREGLTTG